MSPDSTSPLAALTHEGLAPRVGEVFEMRITEAQTVALTLSEVKKLGGGRPGRRAPFSLIFRPADPRFYAPQQIYLLTHPKLGPLDIFLVPIQPDAVGARFEAVFT